VVRSEPQPNNASYDGLNGPIFLGGRGGVPGIVVLSGYAGTLAAAAAAAILAGAFGKRQLRTRFGRV
jgi:hypothetical protein